MIERNKNGGKKMKSKKILTFFLSMLMLITCIPFQIFAITRTRKLIIYPENNFYKWYVDENRLSSVYIMPGEKGNEISISVIPKGERYSTISYSKESSSPADDKFNVELKRRLVSGGAPGEITGDEVYDETLEITVNADKKTKDFYDALQISLSTGAISGNVPGTEELTFLLCLPVYVEEITDEDFTQVSYGNKEDFLKAFSEIYFDPTDKGELNLDKVSSSIKNPNIDSTGKWKMYCYKHGNLNSIRKATGVDFGKLVTAKDSKNWQFIGWNNGLGTKDYYKDLEAIKTDSNKTYTAEYKWVGADVVEQKGSDIPVKPDYFTKIIIDKGDHGNLQDSNTDGQRIYWVNPRKQVTIPAPGVTPNTNWNHDGWSTSLTGTFTNEQTIYAKYSYNGKNLVVQQGTTRPDVPENYVKIEFLKGAHGELTGDTIYWANPKEQVTIPAPGVNPSANWSHKGWNKSLTGIFGTTTQITAEYTYSGADVVAQKPRQNKPDVPNNYVLVEFSDGDGTKGVIPSSSTSLYWVNPDKEVTVTAPRVIVLPGYKHDGWDKPLKQRFTNGTTITANYSEVETGLVDPSEIENPDTNNFWTVTFKSADESKGTIDAANTVYVPKSLKKTLADIVSPTPNPANGFRFKEWSPKLDANTKIDKDIEVKAIFASTTFDPEHVEKMVVKEQPTKLIYTEGEKLELAGLEVTLTDNQGVTKDVAFKDFAANGITAEPTDGTALTLANNTKKVTLTKDNLTAETEALTVNAKVFDPTHVEKMVVKEQPTKLIYTEGEKLALAGLVVTLTDNQGVTKDVAFKDFAANGITTNPTDGTALTLADNETPVTLTKGSLQDETANLTVNAKITPQDPIVGPVDPSVTPNPDEAKNWTVTFVADQTKGTIDAKNTFYVPKTAGKTLADLANDAPEVTAKAGFRFTGWNPALDAKTAINGNLTVNATFETTTTPQDPKVVVPDPTHPGTVPTGRVRVTFDAGEGNTIDGRNRYKYLDVLENTAWTDAEVTGQIPSGAKYKDNTKTFDKWDKEVPTEGNVTEETFMAIYGANSFDLYVDTLSVGETGITVRTSIPKVKITIIKGGKVLKEAYTNDLGLSTIILDDYTKTDENYQIKGEKEGYISKEVSIKVLSI